ncbi:MAG: hypothetical protein AAF922_16640 [Pseudomonadota bacterium]
MRITANHSQDLETSFVTDAMEDAARKRLAGGAHDLVEMAASLIVFAMVSADTSAAS